MMAFILGLIAGFVAPMFEGAIKRGLDGALMAEAPLDAVELRCIAFAACLFGAAIIAALISTASGIPLTLGALIGVFAPKAIARFR